MLTWTVTERPVPGLRMWTAGGDRMLLTQADCPVLIAQVSPDRCEVNYLRTELYRSPVQPIRADQARRRPPAAAEGWAEHFRTALTGAKTGPLRDGAWAICPVQIVIPAAPQRGLVHVRPVDVMIDARGELDWFGMGLDWLPLGRVPGPDEGRVKAYRKLAQDGDLPPILTWWVSGLQAHVILDGLSRMAAAWAQDIPVAVLTLVEVDPERVDDAMGRIVDGYQERVHGIRNLDEERAERAHTYLSQQLADNLLFAQTRGISRAWPLPGGTAQWSSVADANGWGTSSG